METKVFVNGRIVYTKIPNEVQEILAVFPDTAIVHRYNENGIDMWIIIDTVDKIRLMKIIDATARLGRSVDVNKVESNKYNVSMKVVYYV